MQRARGTIRKNNSIRSIYSLNAPWSQIIQMCAIDVDQHLRGRDFAQIAERAVGGALEMILHHVRAHLLVVEALQAADLARVVHLRRFAGRHFQGVRGNSLPEPLPEDSVETSLREARGITVSKPPVVNLATTNRARYPTTRINWN